MRTPRSWPVEEGRVMLSDAGSAALAVDARPQPISIDPRRLALVVVDMQNDFCAEGGWLSSIGVDTAAARTPIPVIDTLAARLRLHGIPVIWVNWANRPDRANLPPNVLHVYDPDSTEVGIGARVGASDAVLTAGSWGAAIVDGLHVATSDIHVGKYRMSGFWDTPLDSILRAHRVDTVLFAGVNADQCVLASLIDAACLGYDCVLVEDASATTSPDFCMAATVYNVRQCFGFTAVSADVLDAFRPDRGQPLTTPDAL